MSDVVVDVETVAPNWDELPGSTRAYMAERARKRAQWDHEDSGDPEESAASRLALELGLAQIVAIGMWNVDENRGLVLLNGDAARVDGAQVVTGTEEGILAHFWSVLAQFRKLRVVTFNGRMFDGPQLMVRSSQLGVPCLKNLVPYRYDLSDHCDLADALTFQGALRGGYTLDYWCERYGIVSPKADGVTGADVTRLYLAGELDAIGAYVLRDVQAEGELYRRLRDSWFLGSFKGGPLPAQKAAAA